MNNLIVSANRTKNPSFEPQEKKIGFSETDILRKAYELIFENSDLFFSELTNAFTVEKERKESNQLI